MDANHPYWQEWGSFLHRHKMNETVAALVEAAGPLTIIGAQVAYLLQPFFHTQRWQSLASLLENPEEGKSFAAYLRQEEILK